MNFERNGKAKESMGIGLTPEAVEIQSLFADLSLQRIQKNGGVETREYTLKKRWFIPTERVLPVMNMKKVSAWKLRFLFKAKSLEPDFLESFWTFAAPWICIRNRNRRIKKARAYAEVNLNNMMITTHNDRGYNRSSLIFSLITEDMEKVQKMKVSNKRIERVIYKNKIYKINPSSLILE